MSDYPEFPVQGRWRVDGSSQRVFSLDHRTRFGVVAARVREFYAGNRIEWRIERLIDDAGKFAGVSWIGDVAPAITRGQGIGSGIKNLPVNWRLPAYPHRNFR